MSNKVFFHNARASARQNRLDKIKNLYKHARLGEIIEKGDRVAIKAHWGEPGNVGYLSVAYVRTIVDLVKKSGGIPYITDTNTLYTGMRKNGPDNIMAAAMNGFTIGTLGAPVIIADGVSGRDYREVAIDKTHIKKAKIASGILDADAMIVVSHVKGHMLFGYGGALKNLGMGCATPAGKQILHSDVIPKVDKERCEGDGICVKRCPQNCISMVTNKGGGRSKKVAKIDASECIGCGECTASCPANAIPINWATSHDVLQQKTAEYALAAVSEKKQKVGYINMIIQVTPDCDCCNWDDNPFVSDVGFAASLDPVALDTASVDLVSKAPPLPDSNAEKVQGDVWKSVHNVDYRIILEHAEKIGLGTTKYDLIRL
jgi:uncharacterized Fe-S center protein